MKRALTLLLIGVMLLSTLVGFKFGKGNDEESESVIDTKNDVVETQPE